MSLVRLEIAKWQGAFVFDGSMLCLHPHNSRVFFSVSPLAAAAVGTGTINGADIHRAERGR